MKTEQSRTGTFSSSQIGRLAKSGKAKGSKGAPYYSYVQEKRIEKRLGRQLQKEQGARATSWGTYVEMFAFKQTGIEFKLVSKKRYFHKFIENWSGMPDILTEKVVGDIKCPWTLLSFCKLVDILEEAKKNGESIGEALKKAEWNYYWQLVSNGELTGRRKAVLILYMPYEDELQEIKDSVSNFDGDVTNLFFISNALEDELPYLVRGNYYKNLYQFEFDIPEEDVKFLTERVIEANSEI